MYSIDPLRIFLMYCDCLRVITYGSHDGYEQPLMSALMVVGFVVPSVTSNHEWSIRDEWTFMS
jgi:hypothetical protein